ncbi:MAG TPA: lipocalin-like domain-containing protein [Thermoanaerobaculia bacterium]|nr:lipocalin-like domain-containing protein [Thermoanaerobaculia bacterium]
MSDFERFVGVWELETIEDSSDMRRLRRQPRGAFENAVGLLIYLPSGVMSVNFAGASRIHFLREFFPSPSELAEAGAAYGGYAGRWELDEPRREILHHVETAFVPNRIGRTIRRSYTFSEDLSRLFLRPVALSPHDEAPARILTWRRRSAP